MPLIQHLQGIAIVTLLAANPIAGQAAGQPSPEWLRGSGNDLQIRLNGEILEADGQPATNIQLTCQLNATVSKQQLKPAVQGHRFEAWIPVNQPNWHSIWLQAASANNNHVAFKTLNSYELRQTAID